MSMKIRFVATVVCEHESRDGSGCTERAAFTGAPEAARLEDFATEARHHFQSLGWACNRPGKAPNNLCPAHNR